MDRRTFIGTLTGTLLAEPLAAQAQPSGGGAHVGRLSVDAGSFDDAGRNAFGAALRELGWIVGANLVVEARYAAGQPDRLSALAAELVRLKVDLIITVFNEETLAAQQAYALCQGQRVEPCPRIGDYVTATGRLCHGDGPPRPSSPPPGGLNVDYPLPLILPTCGGHGRQHGVDVALISAGPN